MPSVPAPIRAICCWSLNGSAPLSRLGGTCRVRGSTSRSSGGVIRKRITSKPLGRYRSHTMIANWPPACSGVRGDSSRTTICRSVADNVEDQDRLVKFIKAKLPKPVRDLWE